MTQLGVRRAAQIGMLLAITLAVSGCFYGPAPYYGGYPHYYRPAPYYSSGYGPGYGYRPYWH